MKRVYIKTHQGQREGALFLAKEEGERKMGWGWCDTYSGGRGKEQEKRGEL